MSEQEISLFVPGRLCLFGEHTDWAGMYRTTNSKLEKGMAIVTGIQEGIYARAHRSNKFVITSDLELYNGEVLECEMDSEKLIEIAQKGGFFSYVAGVASYINDNYSVGGVEVCVTRMDLPIRSGLSSSAAICVLIARAFNKLYKLRMNTQGEMQAAFRGEQRTPSRCGRLDQACAYGIKPVLMEFDGVEINSKVLPVGTTFRWVIANLMSSKDTIKILSDLNKCYPFAESERETCVQEALGIDNRCFVKKAEECLKNGDPEELGRIMKRWQENFDRKVMPACDELKAPVLHEILSDPIIDNWIYGGKGVGSQGDGSVQFLVKNEESMKALQKYLEKEKGMPSFSLILKPGQTVKKAIIPLAGFGTRVFPATKCIKKCFLPILDTDGNLKPALMIMLEQLIEAGIEEICLVIGDDEKAEFERFFEPVSRENYEKLPQDKKELQWELTRMQHKITYVVQKERKGFGHAVWMCKNFAGDEPVLLMLGDFLYKSDINQNCCEQVINAFKEFGKDLVSIHEVSLDEVAHYGILSGCWDDENESVMDVQRFVEKPTDDFAKEYLGVENRKKEKKYYATFGQYVLTPCLFEELDRLIKYGKPTEGTEFGLTAVLDSVREKYGLVGYIPKGKSFDIGLPEEYKKTMIAFGKL
ncbi:sugar phosphate nucleotidyltransferase [Butyrivibrio sp. AD3002]|uniref:sugar phosphate nucleotidyltransferase n=1 Tax=Butyrivibrio sp. AD3002 TaxID=1280670 RepID=UPI0003B73DF2|nr:sugar phosphate nucleotidyltransferase [Butyrivibrio sp. AD3002]